MWKGFLQLEREEIKKRLKSGGKFYTLIQNHDGTVVGANDDSIGPIEKIMNNYRVLGCFTDLSKAREYQNECFKYVLKNEEKVMLLRGMSCPYRKKFKKHFNIGLVKSIALGKQRYIRFRIIPFFTDKELLVCKNEKEETQNRVKFLLSYFWADVCFKDCFKILEFFKDESVGFNIAEKIEENRMRYDFCDRELPDVVKNEDKKLFVKNSPDICHYDIVDVEVDKKYPPYLICKELDSSIFREKKTK